MRRLFGHWLRWTGLVATALLLALTLGSLRWGVTLETPRVAAHLVPAKIAVLWRDAPWTGVTTWRLTGPARYGSRYGQWDYWTLRTDQYTLFLPLWVLWVVIAAQWAAAVWRGLRRGPPGHCLRCRYNLTGLAAGAPCPECGHARPPARGPATPRG